MMILKRTTPYGRPLRSMAECPAQRGFTMIEMMIAIVLGILIVLALTALFVNISRTNNEMAKANSQIENGRFAIQLLQGDIEHGGFWGGYVPQFDDLTYYGVVPGDAPSAVPAPCQAWSAADNANLIGIPVQSYDGVPSGCSALLDHKKANTDVLLVRHAETCLPGDANCEASVAGKLYFQSTQCEQELSAPVQAASASSITLAAFSSAVDDYYKGSTIRILSGPGAGQTRVISGYTGSSRVATVSVNWTSMPDNTSTYAIGYGYVLGTGGFIYHKRDCTTAADKRKFVSSIYYVRDYSSTVGDGIPTLVRSQFDLSGGVLAHQAAVPLIEGIEGFRVELGIDGQGDVDPSTGSRTVVDYTKSLVWANLNYRSTPLNRGDGIPDVYVHCTTASPCTASAPSGTAAQLPNVVAVKLYVLARNTEATVGYTDGKTYSLGSSTLGPFNDHFKRHVFSTTVRLTNVSGRRETP